MQEGLSQHIPDDLLPVLRGGQRNLSRRLVWQELVMVSDLPATTRLMAWVVSAHVGEDERSWSIPYLAKKAGLSDKPARLALNRLERDLWITRARAKGSTYWWVLRWPNLRSFQPDPPVESTKGVRLLQPVTGTSFHRDISGFSAPLEAEEERVAL